MCRVFCIFVPLLLAALLLGLYAGLGSTVPLEVAADDLHEIILSGVHPSEYTVGQDLLGGTDARILVDASLIGAYQTNYFWSVYGARIFPLQAEDERR